MFRCPDLASQVHTLKDDDIRQAFERASGGEATVLAFFEHDRRDVTFDRLADVYRLIGEIGKEYASTKNKNSEIRIFGQNYAIAISKGESSDFNGCANDT